MKADLKSSFWLNYDGPSNRIIYNLSFEELSLTLKRNIIEYPYKLYNMMYITLNLRFWVTIKKFIKFLKIFHQFKMWFVKF